MAACGSHWLSGAGQARLVNPWIAFFLALVTLGTFVSQWRYYRRIGRAQELAGLEHRISHVAGFLLYLVALFLLPFEIPYAQHHLNRLWEHVEAEREKRRLGMRGRPPAVGV